MSFLLVVTSSVIYRRWCVARKDPKYYHVANFLNRSVGLGNVNDMKFLRNSVFVVEMSTLYGVSAAFKGKISSGQLSVKKIKTVGKNVKDFLLTYLLLVM